MNVLRCDLPGCPSKFYSASMISLIRTQAANDGWTRQKLGRFHGWEEFGYGSKPRKLIDCCPNCKPRPRMEGAKPGVDMAGAL